MDWGQVGSYRSGEIEEVDKWTTFLFMFKTHCTSSLKPQVTGEEGGGGRGIEGQTDVIR